MLLVVAIMPCKLNRRAYEQLIRENIQAMDELKQEFIDGGRLLEWQHIVAVLKYSPDREYGSKGD